MKGERNGPYDVTTSSCASRHESPEAKFDQVSSSTKRGRGLSPSKYSRHSDPFMQETTLIQASEDGSALKNGHGRPWVVESLVGLGWVGLVVILVD